MQPPLNQNSSPQSKKNSSEAVFELLSDYLFDSVNLISGTFAIAGANTSTTTYTTGLRVIDTSQRQFMRPDRKIRFRCSFYLNQPTKALAYIFVPATYDLQTPSPTLISELISYVGIKIDQGEVSLVTKNPTDGEKTVSTTFRIEADPLVLPTFSKTYYLEMQYEVTHINVFINNVFLGSIACEMTKNLYTYQTFYPLIAPIKSTDGTSVNLTMESYQILQDK